jgi:hypothetical protein
MRSIRQRFREIGVVVLAAVALFVAAPTATAASRHRIPTKIVATGTFPPSPLPTFGTANADGSLPFTATYSLVGDLTGDVTATGTMSIDNANQTFTQHRTVGTFVGTLAGVGPVRLKFVTTIPTTKLSADTTESGSVVATAGKVKGYRGTIVNQISNDATGQSVGTGTYRITLKKHTNKKR